jgi:hypothetical protein
MGETSDPSSKVVLQLRSARIESIVFDSTLLVAMLRTALVGLMVAAAPVQAGQILRVGVTDGSQPCSYRQQGSWSGMPVELWQRIADQEKLAYVLVPQQNAVTLLSATQRGELDAAIGRITVSPERLPSNRFSPMTSPENTQEPEQEVQELTDENLEACSGGNVTPSARAAIGVEDVVPELNWSALAIGGGRSANSGAG